MAGTVRSLILGEDGTVELVLEAGDLELSQLPMQVRVKINGTSFTLYPRMQVSPGIYSCIIQPRWKSLAKTVCVPGAAVEVE